MIQLLHMLVSAWCTRAQSRSDRGEGCQNFTEASHDRRPGGIVSIAHRRKVIPLNRRSRRVSRHARAAKAHDDVSICQRRCREGSRDAAPSIHVEAVRQQTLDHVIGNHGVRLETGGRYVDVVSGCVGKPGEMLSRYDAFRGPVLTHEQNSDS